VGTGFTGNVAERLFEYSRHILAGRLGGGGVASLATTVLTMVLSLQELAIQASVTPSRVT